MLSYQSINKEHIKCPICLEIKNINDSVIGKCNHSWCKTCSNDIQMNKCPICRNIFLEKTLQGHWEKQSTIYKWVSLEERMLKEKKLAEKKLNTKEYKKQRREEMLLGFMSVMSNLPLAMDI